MFYQWNRVLHLSRIIFIFDFCEIKIIVSFYGLYFYVKPVFPIFSKERRLVIMVFRILFFVEGVWSRLTSFSLTGESKPSNFITKNFSLKEKKQPHAIILIFFKISMFTAKQFVGIHRVYFPKKKQKIECIFKQ